ncbi:MAG: hypothetical protein OEV42_16585 [Deltaproteobacteria bacterium]|nr:hypothetical protein [Deltaproteobacteria bacterium]
MIKRFCSHEAGLSPLVKWTPSFLSVLFFRAASPLHNSLLLLHLTDVDSPQARIP